ncbi:hypothetical protein D187_007659 [Cystobacter fuscus DSM 2262]|uniref:phosphoglycolate phosphatase n=1 Tax=Cystobacter fuscus (strain ATCC 25194 / DSM 2262 / NBRC 100088 / M29) TaxID=1242864 RepID=S9P213_CYSF2|nr:HAD family hydrolase [Cystobacter fuscus]EPX56317.1 hypothetical protein D187_007659 [Cystobacter fuscus DSM 2262]
MQLLITDLDNTLYDWVTFFSKAFQAMIRELSGLLGCSEDELLEQFKAVHQHYGNSEQPYAVLELPAVHARFGHLSRPELLQALDPALHVFNRARKQHLRLYDGVETTLARAHAAGTVIVGYTEAILENAYFRLKSLGIDKYFHHLYCLEGRWSGHPDAAREEVLRPPLGFVERIPLSERKPSPRLLLDICQREGVNPRDAWYVGDSITRDIRMAKEACIHAVWAKYGTRYERHLWDLLVRITHWTDEAVAQDVRLREDSVGIQPDFVIDSFAELERLLGLSR